MFSKRPIRVKSLVGLGLLVVMMALLAGGGLYATYAYRTLVKSLSWRVGELPLAGELSSRVSDLRITLSELRGLRSGSFTDPRQDLIPIRVRMVREQFRGQLEDVEATLAEYRSQLDEKPEADRRMADNQPERDSVGRIDIALEKIREVNRDQGWIFDDAKVCQLESELESLQFLATDLPSHLHNKLRGFAAEVRGQYRTLIVGIWIMSILSGLLFVLFVQLFYRWVFVPLRILIRGSREVAGGNFGFRIHLLADDEMAELAEAMNGMTARFQAIRDDLDRQVQEQTKQVIRSEQLASVGFLAAGVAHEINNPLASIAMCAESLESRTKELIASTAETSSAAEAPLQSEQCAVICHYLEMIQSEAFRCKEITEKLLDFSRIGPPKRQDTDLRELTQGVIEMIGHLGKYHDKRIELASGPSVIAPVNAQEIKQVVLNLLTNALDSIDEDGWVRLELISRTGMAEISVADNGCGMGPEVLEKVFEPFFTRRRAGQGTGLGLSITYRIVADHGGFLDATSPGPGKGATFRVRLPLVATNRQIDKNRRAA